VSDVEVPAPGFDRRLIAPMVLGAILNPVNSSMIAVALVPIGLAFHALPAETAWLVSALYLATATGQPVAGRLVDRYGPRRLYLVGTALVGVAGVLGLVAPSLGVLVAARVLLGLGTCAGYPAAMYLIRSESRRTGVDSPAGVLTTLAVSAQTIVVIGPTLGGLLIGAGGWRTTFAVNIPLAIACLVLGWLRLPSTETREAGAGDAGFDYLGVALFAGTLTALMVYLMAPTPEHLWLAGLAVLIGAGFAVRELRVADPFIDLRVFGGNAPLIATYARSLLAQTSAYAFLYGFTQWLEAGRGLSASHAGLVLLPMFLVGIGVSALTGRRPGLRAKLLAGAGSQIVAAALLLVLDGTSALWIPVVVALICGLPQGLNNLANQNAVYYQADPARMGASAGLLRTFTYLGAMVASAAYGGFFRHGATTAGLHGLAVFLIVVGSLLLALTMADRSLARFGPRASRGPAEASSTHQPVSDSHETGLPERRSRMTLSTLDPNTALVVIDLQGGILAAPKTPIPVDDVVDRTVELAETFRAHGLPVVLVRVTAAADGADATPGRIGAPRRSGALPEDFDVIIERLRGENDIIVTKRTWGAFYGTDLDLHLRRRGVTQVVLAGVATSIGVESTARAAHEHGYHVTLATDAMTDINEEAHRNSIERIFPMLGESGDTAEIVELLAKTR